MTRLAAALVAQAGRPAQRPPRGSARGLRYSCFAIVAVQSIATGVGAGLQTGPTPQHGLKAVPYIQTTVQQHPPIDTTVTGKAIAGAVAYSNPALPLSGRMEPSQGSRFYVVELAVGESDVAAELDTFRLVVAGGAEYVAVAAGGGANLLFPIDKLPMGREMTQILPIDGIIAVTRNSITSVIVETTPKATLALLYEIPEAASVSALKLPDGTSRAIK